MKAMILILAGFVLPTTIATVAFGGEANALTTQRPAAEVQVHCVRVVTRNDAARQGSGAEALPQ